MKTKIKMLTTCGLLASALMLVNCSREEDTFDVSQPHKKKALSIYDFSLWSTISLKPYYIGTSGICVPVGNVTPSYLGAQQKSGISASAFYFYGCFKGGKNAYSGASEAAVFVCDNVTTWNGNEMGFLITLNDNVLKAYLQGGGNYIYKVIGNNDNGYHSFKCVAKSNDPRTVDFYVDDVYKCTLTNPKGSYYKRNFYMVGTTHWEGGSSNPTGQQIEMYNMNIW